MTCPPYYGRTLAEERLGAVLEASRRAAAGIESTRLIGKNRHTGESMKIDAHQHFWRYSPEEYGWISEQMAVLKRDFLPEDLKPLLAQAGFQGSVAVQARQTLEETRWLLELANKHPSIMGVVGWVDLCGRDVEQQLGTLTHNPKLVGVRHVVQDEAEDRFMLREDFLRGMEVLGPFDLVYDILIFPKHLPVACELVSRFPRQRFVMDHIAKPVIREGLMEPWRTQIRELAGFPNVTCKVSGMVTEAVWDRWRPEDLWSYLDVVVEAFGIERLMAGSDWPVCTLAGSYEQVFDVVRQYSSQQFSAAEQTALFGDNAARFYRLAE